MIGNVAKIEELTEGNTDFRRVLYSGLKLQLVLMSVAAGEELSGEIHADTDQFFCPSSKKLEPRRLKNKRDFVSSGCRYYAAALR